MADNLDNNCLPQSKTTKKVVIIGAKDIVSSKSEEESHSLTDSGSFIDNFLQDIKEDDGAN